MIVCVPVSFYPTHTRTHARTHRACKQERAHVPGWRRSAIAAPNPQPSEHHCTRAHSTNEEGGRSGVSSKENQACVHTHTHTHTHIQMRTHTRTHARTHTRTRTHTHTHRNEAFKQASLYLLLASSSSKRALIMSMSSWLHTSLATRTACNHCTKVTPTIIIMVEVSKMRCKPHLFLQQSPHRHRHTHA